MSEVFYLNGKLVPREQAKVSILDYGFLYGYGLYETVRAYGGRPFRLEYHLERLHYSGQRLGISIRRAELRQAVEDTLKANPFDQTRIRITVSVGEGSITPDIASCGEPTYAVLVTEYKPYGAEKYSKGFALVVSSIGRNSRSPVTYMKSANTIESMLARLEARRAGTEEVLFHNQKGLITEAAGSNFFIVRDGALVTSSYEAGILPGVTRVLVLERAARLGIPVCETTVKLKDVLSADEAFLTNSLIEVMPVASVNGRAIGGDKRPITERLSRAYRRLVKKETGA